MINLNGFGSGNDPVKVLPWHFLGWTEERHKTLMTVTLLGAIQNGHLLNTLRMRSFKLFKCPFLGFLTILTL